MKRKIVYLSLLFLAVILFNFGCSSNTKSNVNPTQGSVGASVAIQNFAFVPDTVHIKAGSAVEWTNKDTAPHTATSLETLFDSGSLSTDQKFSFTFSTPGTYHYHCLIHSMMKTAVVVVTN